MIIGRRGWVAGALLALAASACSSAPIHEAGALPEQLELCGRTWERDALDRRWSAAEIRDVLAVEPAIVERLDACPAGACTDVAQSSACHTVIFVRVGSDAYLDYSLQGGP